MKTKIIYISGGETFEMAQIRAAFDEVRNALGLDNQTVLFGVPVDCDSALTEDLNVADTGAEICATAIKTDKTISSEDATPIPQTEIISQPIAEQIEESVFETDTDVVADEIIISETEVATQDAGSESDKVIPILSVLASKAADETEINKIIETTETAEATEQVAAIESTDFIPTDTEIISDIQIDSELVAPMTEDNVAAEKITLGDMIDEAAPAKPVEKTLEQLLESMTPLREDLEHEIPTAEQFETWDTDNTFAETDTDATLAQLASEFAETEDKIVATPKSETHGKIGKLKNILPFKKAKRDDSSLMGDLFGWAGVAANDDDFSIPGFFTPARKQGS